MPRPLRRSLTPALVAVALGISLLGVVSPAQARPDAESRRATAPVVTVTYGDDGATFALSRTSIRPGGVVFRTSGALNGGNLELVQLHRGYSQQDLFADWPRARSGKVPAVRRLNRGVTFYGGAMVFMYDPSSFALDVRRGAYLLVDLDTKHAERLSVRGARRTSVLPRVAGSADFTPGGLDAPATMPGSGWLRQSNHTSQVQLALVDGVEPSTTRRQVRRYYASHGTRGSIATLPTWVAGAMVSPGHTFQWRYDLGAGQFLLHGFLVRARDGDDPAWHGQWDLTHLR
jgi:hypothetical protein